MRLLSSEAKDWKSRVVTEAEEVLCRESAQVAQQATETQEAMDKRDKAKWRQAETDFKALCQSDSAQVQCLASKLHESNEEHQQLHTANERQLRLEAQTLREAQQQEQLEHAIRELRRQAEEQPEIQKRLWKRQLSQQSTYKAEIHELYTEMLNMREKSEMQSHLAANMCKIEHSVPSRSVESEPESVLNTLSPGRCSRWILPEELETPNRPTSSGLQSLVGVPVQLGPSPQTREYVHPRDREEECELFGEVPPGQNLDLSCNVSENEEHQDELDNAAALHPAQAPLQSISGARCVNGNLARPDNTEEESASTACRPSVVHAPGGAALGRGPPGFWQVSRQYSMQTHTSTPTSTSTSASST